jgi:hypothetical protein
MASEDIKVLRERTGAGILDCKKARDRLLRLSEPDQKPPDPNTVDLVDWVPHVAEEVDDADLGGAIAHALEGEDADA